MRTVLESEVFKNKKKHSKLVIPLGEDINGEIIADSIEKMPHMMIAGSTGSGKSVCINAILLALLCQNSPQELKLILVDPKRVELSLYNKIPHLLTPVITDISKVVGALKWAVEEMEERYKLLQELKVRDIFSFNEKVARGKKRQVFNEETGKYEYEELEKLPNIVIVIDELADIMMAYSKEVEAAIARLTQMARAVGIHLIVSTQRPSVEVITGLIKNNIPVRVAFKVPTQVDSRTILDMAGAEKLLGNGDMLYQGSGSTKPKRVQGVFVPEKEVRWVVKFIKEQAANCKIEQENIRTKAIAEALEESLSKPALDSSDGAKNEKDQQLFEAAKQLVVETRRASTTFIQRRLGIGYVRAANLMDMLEEAGVVSRAEGNNKPRKVLVGGEERMGAEEVEPKQVADDRREKEHVKEI
jgi:S-DNA-T family DNA segregation ATPase FtsK/SpoIIIE